MPDFIAGLAKGIEQSHGLVEKAISGVASDMVLNPKVGAVDYAGAVGGSVTGTSESTAGIVGAIREAVGGGGRYHRRNRSGNCAAGCGAPGRGDNIRQFFGQSGLAEEIDCIL